MQYQGKFLGGVFELSFNNTDLLIETCNYFCAFATKIGIFSSHFVFWKFLIHLIYLLSEILESEF